MTQMSADVPRLLDVLGIKTRHHGTELWGPCPHPDHKETRPSWSICNSPQSPNNGAHFCFGCNFKGGPVDLVQAVLGLSMGGSRQWITDRNLWLKGSLPLAVTLVVTKLLTNKLRIPGGLLSGPLPSWTTSVRKYASKRGLTEQQIRRWDICYAVDGSMEGRIVFPVKDANEEWLGWHARTFCDQEKRYKNASHEDGYDPGAVWGMRHWPPYDARVGEALVVTEGALDALACERAGARFLAAIGGSEPHPRQLLKLQQWERLLVATDGDKAGDKVFQSLCSSLGKRCQIVRVEIPRDYDAAELHQSVLRDLLCLVTPNHTSIEEDQSERRASPDESVVQATTVKRTRRLLRRSPTTCDGQKATSQGQPGR